MTATLPRLYDDLAAWWPLLSPPDEYDAEAAHLVERLGATPGSRPRTMLELGAGGGSLASHLERRYRLTLTDRSPDMLAVSRAVNPDCEHVEGDMLTLRLGREFDVVLIHDAICYLTEPAGVQAALRTAAVHCRPGGTVAVLPDYVRETFEPGSEHDGHDAPDGRGLRWLEWRWDPDPSDDTYVVDYAILLRAADGRVTVEHDRHVEGLYPRDQWLRWLADAGISACASADAFGRIVFVGVRSA